VHLSTDHFALSLWAEEVGLGLLWTEKSNLVVNYIVKGISLSK